MSKKLVTAIDAGRRKCWSIFIRTSNSCDHLVELTWAWPCLPSIKYAWSLMAPTCWISLPMSLQSTFTGYKHYQWWRQLHIYTKIVIISYMQTTNLDKIWIKYPWKWFKLPQLPSTLHCWLVSKIQNIIICLQNWYFNTTLSNANWGLFPPKKCSIFASQFCLKTLVPCYVSVCICCAAIAVELF